VLYRTVRLIGETVDADVKVVVRDLSDRRYLVAGSSRTKDKPTVGNGDLDKIASSRHLWDKDRTVLLWGDTWWTRAALTDVLTRPLDEWHLWLRYGPHDHGGELFAFAWPGSSNGVVDEALDRALTAHSDGDLAHAGHNRRAVRGGWAFARALSGLGWADHGPYRNSTVVDDWTEDMDTPRDWNEWCLRWATSPDEREEMRR